MLCSTINGSEKLHIIYKVFKHITIFKAIILSLILGFHFETQVQILGLNLILQVFNAQTSAVMAPISCINKNLLYGYTAKQHLAFYIIALLGWLSGMWSHSLAIASPTHCPSCRLGERSG